MAENIQRNTGRGSEYKLDRGGAAADPGPFIGIVKNNVDPTRSGRLQVFITELASGSDQTDTSVWRTVSYLPPYYGVTPNTASSETEGDYVGNRHSYGMWFTPPDLETRVLCFFANGDPNLGYYVGCIPEPGLTHMVPAIGATAQAKRDNKAQEKLFGGATRLPVAEINDKNDEIREDPRFHDKVKPVHSYTAATLFQQGLINDRTRGPIGSSSQRESPSSVYGISTPGRAIYDGGLSEADIRSQLSSGKLKPQDVKVVGRRGGHTFVMDDGDVEGKDALVRIRTSRGHQLLMSDDGDCFYFIHANGQSWIEMGKEGAIDVYSTNSVNLRTQGELNFHADKSINMYAGEKFNVYAERSIHTETNGTYAAFSSGNMTVHSAATLGILANGSLGIKSDSSAAVSSAGAFSVTGSRINLNSGGAASVNPVTKIVKTKLADAKLTGSGWVSAPATLTSIVPRAPTHEPYSEHNKGVEARVVMEVQPPAPPPPAMPAPPPNEPPLESGISAGDVLNAEKATVAIGKVSPDQVTGMLAQSAKKMEALGQTLTTVSPDGLIGKFGVSVGELEAAGFIKPGVADMLNEVGNVSETITELLSDSSNWTLKGGIDSIAGFLQSEKLQTKVQEQLYSLAHDRLEELGVIQAVADVKQVAGLIQAAANTSPEDVANFVNGKVSAITADVKAQVDAAMQQAKYAVSFVTDKLPAQIAQVGEQAGQIATAARDGLDKTTNEILGNAKIPKIAYQVQTAAAGAQKIASDLQSTANQLTATVRSAVDGFNLG